MTDTTPAERSRTFTWEDPLIGARAAPTMTGLEYLLAMARGELPPPPIMRMMNITFVSAEEGRVVFAVEPAEYHYNPIGMVHGGLACTICDSAMGCAIHTMLPPGAGYTTLELKVNYNRPLTVDTGQVFCEGKVIHVGGRVATAEARITDRAGKLYSHATTTCMIFRG
ncbi:MAG: PaaI family thioesterase [Roseiflexaceae bacterium]